MCGIPYKLCHLLLTESSLCLYDVTPIGKGRNRWLMCDYIDQLKPTDPLVTGQHYSFTDLNTKSLWIFFLKEFLQRRSLPTTHSKFIDLKKCPRGIEKLGHNSRITRITKGYVCALTYAYLRSVLKYSLLVTEKMNFKICNNRWVIIFKYNEAGREFCLSNFFLVPNKWINSQVLIQLKNIFQCFTKILRHQWCHHIQN